MAAFRRTAVLAMILVAQSAAAATLGVAWDPSAEQGVTGYRVYVGTAPGARSDFFDVGRFQTSFVYTAAVAGQRYYFSVATQANGVVGRPSAEVSGVLDTATATVQTQTTGQPLDRGGPSGNPAGLSAGSTSAVSPVVELARGLGAVTSLVTDDAGGTWFIEDGSRIRRVTQEGLVEEVAIDATPGERYLSMAVGPDFSTTRHVFIAAESLTGATRQLSVIRHRFIGGALGESARVIAGLPSVDASARVAVSPDHIYLAQTGSVLRFSSEGSVPRDQTSGGPAWAAWDGTPEAAIWDEGRQGLWVAGGGATGGSRAVLFRETGARAVDVAWASDSQGDIVLSRTSAQVLAHSVLAGDLAATDLSTGFTATGAPPLADAAVSGWIAIADGALFVVAADATKSEYRLVRVSR